MNRVMKMVTVLWLGFGTQGLRAQAKPSSQRMRLNVLTSRSMVGAINVADAQAAGTLWLQTIGRRRGFQLDARFEIANSLEAIKRQIEDYSADLLILDVVEYLKLAPMGLLEPFVGIGRGRAGTEQKNYLVVNRNSGYSSIADLRGKNVISYSRVDLDFGRIWAETLLHEQHLGRAGQFFGSITTVAKPSTACLPVFFGKLDACIVSGAGWEVLTEMNPQLASKLYIIATSPSYLEGLACIHVNHKTFRDELRQSMLELDRDPEGKQLLMVFKGERVINVKDEDTATARELWKKFASFASQTEVASDGMRSGRN